MILIPQTETFLARGHQMPSRVKTANAALSLFATATRIEWRPGRGIFIVWTDAIGVTYSRRWQTVGQDFYPVWKRHWGHGGTATTALSQLVRFVRGRPVLPLPTWQMWTGDRVKLARENGDELVKILRKGGYPESTPCVLCGRPLTRSLDWWSLDGVSGPCCTHNDPDGCRQLCRSDRTTCPKL